jgi:hypothetical protein
MDGDELDLRDGAEQRAAAARSITWWSIVRRSGATTSVNVPLVQCSNPSGERMQTSNRPPTRISTVASGTE